MQVLYNANIYTPKRHAVTAVVIDHGRFVALGSDADILNGFPEAESRSDLEGKTIWPGLTDSHLHLNHLADSMFSVDCETETLQECLDRIRETADTLPQGTWIRGHGWNQNEWEIGFGNAQLLDAVCKGRPAYLTAKSLHAVWVNSRALELANIKSDTFDPPGGLIQRDENNKPTGILFENAAMDMVKSIIPKPTHHERTSKYQGLFNRLFELGLVSVHDFDGLDSWETLVSFHQNNQLNLRVRKSIPLDHLDTFITNRMGTNWGDDSLNIGCVKLFADGALGPQTAAMDRPYEGSDNKGVLILTEKEIVEIGELAAQNGIALAVHAIGDRANHIVLNAFEHLRAFERAHQLPHLLHRIEHVQVIGPKDLPRLSELNITASVQPIHAPSDMEISDKYLGSRSKNAYPFRTLLGNKTHCVFGSDAPVESFNPFQGMHAAITRQRLDGSPNEDGWHPEQRINLHEALAGFSTGPAKLLRNGDHLGHIQERFNADFIILNEDPFALKPAQLADIKPLATFINGKCVYQSDSLPKKFPD